MKKQKGGANVSGFGRPGQKRAELLTIGAMGRKEKRGGERKEKPTRGH